MKKIISFQKLKKPSFYIIMIAIIFLTTIAMRTSLICPDCRVDRQAPQAEGGRYVDAANQLYEAWNAPEELIQGDWTGYVRYFSLYLPFAPHGEKPVFIFAAAAAKSFLSAYFPDHVEKSILWLNVFSLFVIACIIAILISKSSVIIGTVFGILFFNIHDVWVLSIEGYHTTLGIALLLLGILIGGPLKNFRRSLIAGAVLCFSILSSPHTVIPVASYMIVSFVISVLNSGIRKETFINYISATIGFFLILAFSYITFVIQQTSGINSRFALDIIIRESQQARLYGGRLPLDPMFFINYSLFQLGGLGLGLLIIGWCLSITIKGKSHISRVIPWAAIFSIFLTFFMGLPTIGRVQIPNILMLLLSCGFGMAAFTDTLGAGSRRIISTLFSALVSIAFFMRGSELLHASPSVLIRGTDQMVETHLMDVHQKDIVDGSKIYDMEMPEIYDFIADKIVRIDIRRRAGHSDFIYCNFEMMLADLMNGDLEVIAVSTATLDLRTCYANEYHYVGFCQNQLEIAFPRRVELLSMFNPGVLYYLDGNDIIRASELVGVQSLSSYECRAQQMYSGISVEPIMRIE